MRHYRISRLRIPCMVPGSSLDSNTKYTTKIALVDCQACIEAMLIQNCKVLHYKSVGNNDPICGDEGPAALSMMKVNCKVCISISVMQGKAAQIRINVIREVRAASRQMKGFPAQEILTGPPRLECSVCRSEYLMTPGDEATCPTCWEEYEDA